MNTTRPFLALLIVTANVAAQPVLVPDPKFQVKLASAAEASAWNWLVQPDGKIVLAGRFESIRGTAVSDITRLHPDGTIDETFKPERGTIPTPSLVGRQSGNRVLIREADPNFPYDLTLPKTSSVHRLDAEGRLDPSFRWPSGDLRVLAILSDDRIMAYRTAFDSARKVWETHLSRHGADGAVDPTFSASVSPASVFAVAELASGKLLIAGGFTNVFGRAWQKLARLNPDGSLDEAFDATSSVGVAWSITDIAVQTDGRILAQGVGLPFPHVGGVIRLHSDGALDSTFDAVVGHEPGWPAGTGLLSHQPGSDILIYADANNVRGERIVRLRPDGTLLDTVEIDPNLLPGIDGNPRGIAGLGLADMLPDGKVIVRSVTAGGHYLPRLIRLNTGLSVDHTFPPVIPEVSGGEVHILTRSGDKLILSGSFTSVNGHISPRLARLNADGSVDMSFVPDPAIPSLVGLDRAERTLLGAIAALPDGKLLLHGPFGSLVRLNTVGGLDDGFRPSIMIGAPAGFWQFWPAGLQWPILGIQSDGRLVVQKADEGRLVRLGLDGSMDPTFAPVFTGGEADDGDTYSPYTALAVQRDDRIVVAGSFTNVNGVARNGLARLNADGSLDPTFDADVPLEAVTPDGFISELVVDAQDRILVGGRIGRWSVETFGGLVRLNPDGSVDHSFPPPELLLPSANWPEIDVRSVRVLSDGSLLVDSHDRVAVLLRVNGGFAAVFGAGILGDFPGTFPLGQTHQIVRFSDVETDSRSGLLLAGIAVDGGAGAIPTGFLLRCQLAPIFRKPTVTPGANFTTTLGVLPGVPHRIEASSDLVNWQTLTNVTSATENLPFTDPEAAPRRFYRAIGVNP